MILTVPDFLNAEELADVQRLFEHQKHLSGNLTAGATAGAVKNNLEMSLGENADALKKLIRDACNRAPGLNYQLLPRNVSTPILSLYTPGMAYGRHVDSPIGNDYGRVYRTDVSCTVFLAAPGSYDDGELCIDDEDRVRKYKLPAGHAVFYPTADIHQVMPVTRGERRACVFWMESLVRDASKRAMLAELAQLCDWVQETEAPESEHRLRINKLRSNLTRLWLDT